jgi:hypothetical protein
MKKLIALVAVVLGVSACTQTKVSVVCKGNDNGTMDCTLAEVSGSSQVKTCWDVTLECNNGTKPVASACENVIKDKPSLHTFTTADFKNGDKCDKLLGNSVTVGNIKITKD